MRPTQSTRKRYLTLGIVTIFVIFLILFLIPYYRFLTQKVGISPIRALLGIDGLQSIDNKTNILILGIPGGLHEGPTLSDSITFVSYDRKKNRASSIGVPRDVWSETLQDRINSAYAYGEAKIKGGGMRLAKAEVGAIVGIPIHYAVVINFQEFRDLIDLLGGVDIEVQRSFTDKKFPIEGKENENCSGDPEFRCRYETVSFKKGLTHMSGETALNFVRSRNAEGDEGSDFARNQRQQLVMSAVKEKVVLTVLSFNLPKIQKLYDSLNKLVERDMTNQQVAIIARHILFGGKFQQKAAVIPREMFTVPDPFWYEGKYVLIPEKVSFEKIHHFISTYIGVSIEER